MTYSLETLLSITVMFSEDEKKGDFPFFEKGYRIIAPILLPK